jgi:hypothetical protein
VAGAVLAVATATGTLLGGFAAAGWIGGGNDDTPPSQQGATSGAGTPTSTTTATGPAWTEAQEALGKLVPAAILVDCEPREEPAKGAIAALNCSSGGNLLTYNLYESPRKARNYMTGRLSLGDREKHCGDSASGSSTYHTEDEPIAGHLVCYVREGTAWIEWSSLRASVYAWANRPDGDWKVLFTFWNSAGPKPAPDT